MLSQSCVLSSFVWLKIFLFSGLCFNYADAVGFFFVKIFLMLLFSLLAFDSEI